MGKSLIKCPKDPKIQYYREVCTEIFRKGNLRKWCKQCEVFHDQKSLLVAHNISIYKNRLKFVGRLGNDALLIYETGFSF